MCVEIYASPDIYKNTFAASTAGLYTMSGKAAEKTKTLCGCLES